ncbi:MAG: (d)CMP kinase [Rhodoluna sp.]|nr:(d)CMP kinase [Rhodoluna sp.]MBP6186511.1 (d)CMP kinase [Rhodoluna sp.]
MAEIVVAIDGPAGSGKSSVSKQLARKLGYSYLDTGAAYRALAWATLNGLDSAKLESGDFEEDFDYQISTDPDDFWVRVGGTDVTEAIRSSLISESVSSVAKISNVRSFMKRLTRSIVSASSLDGAIVEGRDITTVVFPDADSRILLTASEEVRLQRRSAEISASSTNAVVNQVTKRDASDSKIVDFMNAAEGVTLVDSSDLNFEQTVEVMSAQIEADLKARKQ